MEEEAKAWFQTHVSRETYANLVTYRDLLIQWQKTINLIAPSTLELIWSRHFFDSAQLCSLVPSSAKSWLDLGSGAGFPGLIIAAIARQNMPELSVTLVESDIRKCAFMREAARKMDLSVHILSRRIADIPIQRADVISARALTDLPTLIEYSKPHLGEATTLIFPKGNSYMMEVKKLEENWQESVEVIKSCVDPDSFILRISPPT